MGANATQAIGVAMFLIGFTVLAGGFAGGGIVVALVGVVLLAAACFFFMKAKPWEEQSE
jgi:hypothetical protein